MAEKVIAYPRDRVPQETGHWCCPASIQTILAGRGISESEAVIARQTEELEGNRGWDDQDGTDYIGQGATVLNRYLPKAGYKVVDWRGYPSAAQKAEFWTRITNAIDAGHGVLVNIDAPATNYPRGTRGSVSPAYGGGEVLHYIAIMGYYDGPDGLHVWVADSGFRPFGYWCSFDQMCTLIPPKGYAYPSTVQAVSAHPVADAELSKRYPSRSKYRADDEPVGTLADYVLWIDARVHERSTERGA